MKLYNQIRRYTLIIELVQKGTYPSKKEILDYLRDKMKDIIETSGNENTGISSRTFDRDKKALKDNGYIIEHCPVNKGYYIETTQQQAQVFNRMLELLHIAQANSYGSSLQLEQVTAKGYNHLNGILHAIQNNYKIEITYLKFDGGESAEGLYINYLHVGNLIIVPQFGYPEDTTALKLIEKAYPDCKVVGHKANWLAKEGGVLNCASWTIRE